MVRGELSEWFDIVDGGPQGSVIVPRLFPSFVNDVQSRFLSELRINSPGVTAPEQVQQSILSCCPCQRASGLA